MKRRARFEIVRTWAGWHARFRGANGQIVWTTEVYARRRVALHAIELLGSVLEVRDVDERSRS